MLKESFEKGIIELVKTKCGACELAKKGDCDPFCCFFEVAMELGGKQDEKIITNANRRRNDNAR